MTRCWAGEGLSSPAPSLLPPWALLTPALLSHQVHLQWDSCDSPSPHTLTLPMNTQKPVHNLDT